jgi:nucleotide-binding universal stress UspA family protein
VLPREGDHLVRPARRAADAKAAIALGDDASGNRVKDLVATDGSESATEAVEFGIELAAENEAELILVHVVPVLDIVPAAGFGIGGAFPHEASLEDHALLERAAAVAESYGIFPTTVLLAGDTVDEIVAYADSHNVDLIVIGSRGHGAIVNALLGSVSRGVLAESKRPVMVVRGGAPVPTRQWRRRVRVGF